MEYSEEYYSLFPHVYSDNLVSLITFYKRNYYQIKLKSKIEAYEKNSNLRIRGTAIFSYS